MSESDSEVTEQPAETPAPEPVITGPVKTLDFPDEHELAVDTEKRILGLRVLRYNEVVEHPHYGRLLFEPGAFVGDDLGPVRPEAVRLRMDHEDPPTGLGIAWRETPEAPYLDARVSKTARGDEQLTLARDGVSRGTSPGFADIVGRPKQKLVDGKKTTVYGPASAVIREVSTTWAPTFAGDSVMYVLHKQDEKGEAPVAEAQEAPTNGVDYDRLTAAIVAANAKTELEQKRDEKIDRVLMSMEQFQEQARAQFKIPQGEAPKPKLHDWAGQAIRMLGGEVVSPDTLKKLALDDVIIGEQPGLVPDVFTDDFDDLVSDARPFVESLRQIAPPETGTVMTLPILRSRATPYTQTAEKQEISGGSAPKVGTVNFDMSEFIGGADVSLQFILRASSSALDLIIQEMAEANGLAADEAGIDALLNPTTGSAPNDAGVMDPTDPGFGQAWKNAITTYRRAPDTIWLSSNAVAAFIDAKDPLTNAPLYSQLAASFTAGQGAGGVLSGLRPIYVPALDTSGVDVIVGPARSYVFAEVVRARRLQLDIPSKLGRDVVLYGAGFFGPRYPQAFTVWTVAS